MIDFDILRSYMDNDDDIIEAVFMAFLEEHDDGAEKIQQLYNNKDWSELFITAHSLKGILASFGEAQAVEKLETIEGITRQNGEPNADDIDYVVKEIATIKQQISDYLGSMA
ncbi:Hpt domain-containing protein [Vibrio hippocampi]|uniref:HPt domain-containing protein n=1 Tax=Vibrio hippocampi TaxID=654686 RepID=A0ABM8ZG52_9VIBR|nr:Hpt domain-containing protein [Vibrio hippocampi]CAH0525620.1 hypothetical protein VHP8226_01148 [Vibrio hippocampi]